MSYEHAVTKFWWCVSVVHLNQRMKFFAADSILMQFNKPQFYKYFLVLAHLKVVILLPLIAGQIPM